jgi:hypothetical protein
LFTVSVLLDYFSIVFKHKSPVINSGNIILKSNLSDVLILNIGIKTNEALPKRTVKKIP